MPVLHRGAATARPTAALIGPSAFDSHVRKSNDQRSRQPDGRALLRTEANGHVTGRAKMVRSEFVEKVKQSEHWQHQAMVPNLLADGADIWT